jgi:hypothetical protein
VKTLVFETSASTNSAIWAFDYLKLDTKIVDRNYLHNRKF